MNILHSVYLQNRRLFECCNYFRNRAARRALKLYILKKLLHPVEPRLRLGIVFVVRFIEHCSIVASMERERNRGDSGPASRHPGFHFIPSGLRSLRCSAAPTGPGRYTSPVRRRRASQPAWDEASFCLSAQRRRRCARVKRAPRLARSAGDSASAERRLRGSFLLDTFLWTSKEKYPALAGGTAIQSNIAAGDTTSFIAQLRCPLRGRMNWGGNPRRRRVTFFCAAKRKSPKKRPPDGLALRAALRSSSFWARAELAALRQPRASPQNDCGARRRRRDPRGHPQRSSDALKIHALKIRAWTLLAPSRRTAAD